MHTRALLGLLAAVVGLSACGPSEDSGQSGTGGTAPPAEETALDRAKAKAQAAADKASDLAGTAVARGREAAGAAVEKGREMAEQARPAFASAREAADEVADAAVEKARELIQQAQDYIAENKPVLAQKAVNKLNVLKDVMPRSIQAQIDTLNAYLAGKDVSDPADEEPPAPAAPPPAR